MKILGLWIFILGMSFCSCQQKHQDTNSTENKSDTLATSSTATDEEAIQSLIRQVLAWSDSDKSIDILPTITDSKADKYIGLDLTHHQQNLEKLKATNFFATEFIENYNQIIQTLDKGIRSGGYTPWLVGDLPTFAFANAASPWCLCQDSPDWNTVKVKKITLDNEKGEFEWYLDNTSSDNPSGSTDYNYPFRVKKENNSWKIAYMKGFDFNESIRKDG